MARILLPLPDRDFDTTDVAAPWRRSKRPPEAPGSRIANS